MTLKYYIYISLPPLFFFLLTFEQRRHAQPHGRFVIRHVDGDSSGNVDSQSVARILGGAVGARQRLIHNRDAQTPKNRVHFIHRSKLRKLILKCEENGKMLNHQHCLFPDYLSN